MNTYEDLGENRRSIDGVPVLDSGVMLRPLPDAKVIYVVLGDNAEPLLAFDTLEAAVKDAKAYGIVVCIPLKETEND